MRKPGKLFVKYIYLGPVKSSLGPIKFCKIGPIYKNYIVDQGGYMRIMKVTCYMVGVLEMVALLKSNPTCCANTVKC